MTLLELRIRIDKANKRKKRRKKKSKRSCGSNSFIIWLTNGVNWKKASEKQDEQADTKGKKSNQKILAKFAKQKSAYD